VHVDPAGANPTSTRYYSFGGQAVAVRTAAGLSFLGSDRHGTASVAVSSATGAATVRRSDPFGNPGGAASSWPGERGFVGGVADGATGLTHLGARDYDPALGRFISVDPMLDPGDPQQVNGYGYADNNPASFSDPDGMLCTNGPDGMCRTPSGANVATPGVSEQGGGRPAGRPIAASPSPAPAQHCGFRCRARAVGGGLDHVFEVSRAARTAHTFFVEGGFQSPNFANGVVDAAVNTVYAPARLAACQEIYLACGRR